MTETTPSPIRAPFGRQASAAGRFSPATSPIPCRFLRRLVAVIIAAATASSGCSSPAGAPTPVAVPIEPDAHGARRQDMGCLFEYEREVIARSLSEEFRPVGWPEPAENIQVIRRLDDCVLELPFPKGLSLEAMHAHLARSMGCPLEFDWEALREVDAFPATQLGPLERAQIRARSCLVLLGERLNDALRAAARADPDGGLVTHAEFMYDVRDGVVIFTTRDRLDQMQALETHVYDVWDLLIEPNYGELQPSEALNRLRIRSASDEDGPLGYGLLILDRVVRESRLSALEEILVDAATEDGCWQGSLNFFTDQFVLTERARVHRKVSETLAMLRAARARRATPAR